MSGDWLHYKISLKPKKSHQRQQIRSLLPAVIPSSLLSMAVQQMALMAAYPS
jgi:hypothetical protein